MKKFITLILKFMADTFKVCGNKKIEIQKVPCCPKISRGIFYTANSEMNSYPSYWANGVGQTALGASGIMQLTQDKIAGVVMRNTTPHYVKMLAMGTYPNSSDVPQPHTFDLTIPPYGDASQSYPEPRVLQSYNGYIGFSARFFSDAECTQPIPLESGIVEIVFIATAGCSPCSGSGSGSFGIGGVLLENLANNS